MNADYWIEKLNLTTHPEGGFYNEIYRSSELVSANALPERYGEARCFSSSIYFLLKGEQKSKFHRLKTDEIWHFYEGSVVEIFILNEDGSIIVKILGKNVEKNEYFQIVVPRDNWFGARLIDNESFALLGCTLAPGFDFKDFELADRSELLKEYPQYKEIILELT
ncbi:MAG: cupin domain-containing protein [Bacteroidota bacterium]|jgi:hypothetical protein